MDTSEFPRPLRIMKRGNRSILMCRENVRILSGATAAQTERMKEYGI